MTRQVLYLKMGGSLITDKKVAYKPLLNNIQNIADIIKTINQPMIIAHGSGSFGHTSAKKYGGLKSYSSRIGIAKVSRDASAINNIVVDELLKNDLPVVSFRPQSFLLANEGRLKQGFFKPILESLKQGLIPIIYGDVIWDKSWQSTIFSGEKILYELAKYLIKQNYEVNAVIQLSDVDGVMSSDGKIIKEITNSNWRTIKQYIYPLNVTDVTGGMTHKIEQALKATRYNISTYIINGKDKSLEMLLNKTLNSGTLIR